MNERVGNIRYIGELTYRKCCRIFHLYTRFYQMYWCFDFTWSLSKQILLIIRRHSVLLCCYIWPLRVTRAEENVTFCAYIYFKKAFYTVWRDGLWYKLHICNIKGQMYNNIKSRVVYTDSVSNFFPSLNGVDKVKSYLLFGSHYI